MNITTKRLTIRRVESGDWESIKAIWEDQNRSIYACFDRPNSTDPDDVRERIAKWASCADSTEHMFFAVCLDEKLIGFAAFNKRDGGYETGYCFHSDFHGKGYARESMAALIAYIHDLQPDAVITAGTALENIPSVKLLESLGFRLTGTEQISFYKDDNGNDIYFDGGIFQLDVQ